MSEFLRKVFRGVLNKIAGILISVGITPNMVTLVGLAVNLIVGWVISTGRVQLGGVLILLLGPLDAVDGALARLAGKETRFGAFLDSVADRYAELAIFLGLLVFATRSNQNLLAIWVYLAAAGSILVSYTRARAEALGIECKVGILTRAERYLVLIPALIFNRPLAGMLIIGLLANFSAVQRIWHAAREMKD